MPLLTAISICGKFGNREFTNAPDKGLGLGGKQPELIYVEHKHN